MDGMKRIFIVVFIIICLVFVGNSMLMGLKIYKGVKLSQSAQPFSANPTGAGKRLLIVGGGTGAGTGSEKPSGSIAGRIAREFPSVRIVNKSQGWARGADVLTQLQSAADEDFDLVLVLAGEEDVIAFTGIDAIKADYLQILHLAARKAPVVLFVGPDNTGLKPAFFLPVSWVYAERARRVREVFILLSREAGAEYVDLFRDQAEDPFLKSPSKYYAADALHPGNNGYAVWYEDLKGQSSFLDVLVSR